VEQKSILKNLDLLFVNDTSNNYIFDLPDNSGTIGIEKNMVNNDILLYKNNLNFNKDTKVNCSSKEEGLCIDITLDGEINYTDNILEEKIKKQKDTMFVKYVNSSESTYESRENIDNKNIAIVIKGDFLNKYLFEKIKEADNLQEKYSKNIPTVLKKTTANIKTLLLANEIYNSQFQGDLNTLFLQSKVFEIIYNEFNDILKYKPQTLNNDIKLTKEDIEALYMAKTLITEEKYFVNLSELSKKVALNEFKLKYGFKKFFNTSPGAMIIDYRMQEAKELLETTEFSINEISKLVGYKYIQSFSNAFYKKFGVRPKDIMKSRKYYY